MKPSYELSVKDRTELVNVLEDVGSDGECNVGRLIVLLLFIAFYAGRPLNRYVTEINAYRVAKVSAPTLARMFG